MTSSQAYLIKVAVSVLLLYSVNAHSSPEGNGFEYFQSTLDAYKSFAQYEDSGYVTGSGFKDKLYFHTKYERDRVFDFRAQQRLAIPATTRNYSISYKNGKFYKESKGRTEETSFRMAIGSLAGRTGGVSLFVPVYLFSGYPHYTTKAIQSVIKDEGATFIKLKLVFKSKNYDIFYFDKETNILRKIESYSIRNNKQHITTIVYDNIKYR